MQINRRQVWFGLAGLGLSSVLAPTSRAQSNLAADFLAPGTMAEVISGNSFILADGRRVRLAGFDAPRRAIGEAVAQPLSRQSAQVLQQLLQGKKLSFIDLAPDRFGRLRAHVLAGPQLSWVQGEMLANGMGRVRTWADDFAKVGQMLALEEQARRQGAGIWAREFYSVRTPKTITSSRGSFQIVAGEIVDATSLRKMTYLNFGVDWRRDFTAQATKKTTKEFAKSGVNLAGLSGARVRVRGLIKSSNGPVLWLNHPSQLEVLDAEYEF